MSHFIDECFRKVEWAKELLQRLKNEESAYKNQTDCVRLDLERYEDVWVTVLRQHRAVPSYVPLLVGDIVHNLRTALDHATVGLGKKLRRTRAETFAFPFGETAEKFEENVSNMSFLKGDKDFFRQIEAFPYGKNELLWVLHRLDIEDKHRGILVCTYGSILRGISYVVGSPGAPVLTSGCFNMRPDQGLALGFQEAEQLSAHLHHVDHGFSLDMSSLQEGWYPGAIRFLLEVAAVVESTLTAFHSAYPEDEDAPPAPPKYSNLDDLETAMKGTRGIFIMAGGAL